KAFPGAAHRLEYIRELHGLLHEFVQRTALFPEECLPDASEYLYYTLKLDQPFVVATEAAKLAEGFEGHLRDQRFTEAFRAARESVQTHLPSLYELIREWVAGYAGSLSGSNTGDYLDEAAWLVMRGSRGGVVEGTMAREIEGMAGSHQRI